MSMENTDQADLRCSQPQIPVYFRN